MYDHSGAAKNQKEVESVLKKKFIGDGNPTAGIHYR